MLEAINGYKTYIGIVITLIGMTGISKYVTEGQLTIILNGIFDIAGIVVTIIGALHKDFKIDEAKSDF